MQNGLFFTLANSEMVGGSDTESGIGPSPQAEVADLQRQVCPFAVHGISSMNLLHCYTLNGKPSAADFERIVCKNLIMKGICLCLAPV
jgi:hypothetical protein